MNVQFVTLDPQITRNQVAISATVITAWCLHALSALSISISWPLPASSIPGTVSVRVYHVEGVLHLQNSKEEDDYDYSPYEHPSILFLSPEECSLVWGRYVRYSHRGERASLREPGARTLVWWSSQNLCDYCASEGRTATFLAAQRLGNRIRWSRIGHTFEHRDIRLRLSAAGKYPVIHTREVSQSYQLTAINSNKMYNSKLYLQDVCLYLCWVYVSFDASNDLYSHLLVSFTISSEEYLPEGSKTTLPYNFIWIHRIKCA